MTLAAPFELRMLTRLDHIAIVVRDFKSACDDYEALLGCPPACVVADHAQCALFQLDNLVLKLVAKSVADKPSDSANAQLKQDEGIWAIAFATPDIEKARHVLERRGIATAEQNGDPHGRRTFALAVEATHGPNIFVVAADAVASSSSPRADAQVGGLDHIVITTDQPERAAAFYGARLGLEMKLDRTNPDWGSRLMFFKCGDLIVEIAHSLESTAANVSDKLWGLSWRVTDIVAAHTRIAQAGFDISEIRAGRKPGTRVFTVRDRTASVPTLIIGRE
jgi:catechol 2,3-dioxygenase-like lactoylglutathione lyase family enzyme